MGPLAHHLAPALARVGGCPALRWQPAEVLRRTPASGVGTGLNPVDRGGVGCGSSRPVGRLHLRGGWFLMRLGTTAIPVLGRVPTGQEMTGRGNHDGVGCCRGQRIVLAVGGAATGSDQRGWVRGAGPPVPAGRSGQSPGAASRTAGHPTGGGWNAVTVVGAYRQVRRPVSRGCTSRPRRCTRRSPGCGLGGRSQLPGWARSRAGAVWCRGRGCELRVRMVYASASTPAHRPSRWCR